MYNVHLDFIMKSPIDPKTKNKKSKNIAEENTEIEGECWIKI